MIRKSGLSLTDGYSAASEVCPACGKSGSCVIHAYYGRNLISYRHGEKVKQEITIPRVRCSECGRTHAVIPDGIIPHMLYGSDFIFQVLYEYFSGIRTVESICEKYGITRNQFYKWRGRWKQNEERNRVF